MANLRFSCNSWAASVLSSSPSWSLARHLYTIRNDPACLCCGKTLGFEDFRVIDLSLMMIESDPRSFNGPGLC